MRKNNKVKKNKGCSFILFSGIMLILIFFLIMGSNNNGEDERLNYIENTKHLAISLSKRYGLFPSVIVAQSALESNYGRSKLSVEYKNYFGIKGKGKSFNTTEFVDGSKISVNDSFRVYETKEDCFIDYCLLITKAKRYERVLKAKDYREATKLLKECGYATDPKYDEKINFIIDKYALSDLDFEL